MRFIRFSPLFLSIIVLSCASYYYVQLIKKDYYANYLQVVDSIFAKNYKIAKTRKEKERLSDNFAKTLTYLITEIESRPGAWKKMHMVYHTMARASLALGRIGDAGRFLKKSLHYHPYYGNAYDMFGNIWLLLGKRDRERACKAVATAIFKGLRPELSDIRQCNP